jgi:hypothetical protein
MRLTVRIQIPRVVALIASLLTAAVPMCAHAQRAARPAASQAFDAAECRSDCVIDSLVIDVDRGRRAQAGLVTASLVLLDTIPLAKRGAPPTPRDRPVNTWILCDSTPCAAAILSGRIADKRIDDGRVSRRVVATWVLPTAVLLRLSRSTVIGVVAEGRTHPLSAAMIATTHALIESVRSTLAPATSSARATLYVATFASFGVPGDSTLAEDVGTATEPLMIPDATTTPPTRIATLTIAGRGADAVPMLVQDDGTGAAPIFGIGETVTIALPGKVGRRGVVTGKITARQRVEAMRDACQGMKLWTYLVSMSPLDLGNAERGILPSPRPGEAVDRWNGTAVREPVAPRMLAAEQRTIAGSRTVVAQFVRERAASGVRDRDVQVLAALPRGAGFVTNFGIFARDTGGNWRFPGFSLRPATCP